MDSKERITFSSSNSGPDFACDRFLNFRAATRDSVEEIDDAVDDSDDELKSLHAPELVSLKESEFGFWIPPATPASGISSWNSLYPRPCSCKWSRTRSRRSSFRWKRSPSFRSESITSEAYWIRAGWISVWIRSDRLQRRDCFPKSERRAGVVDRIGHTGRTHHGCKYTSEWNQCTKY